jgi:tRNA(Ile2) C34 agmatinyltransferase TiaS
MAGRDEAQYTVTCPHCHREFTSEMLGAGEQRGFKCPHCRLFVPAERADEQELAEPTKS